MRTTFFLRGLSFLNAATCVFKFGYGYLPNQDLYINTSGIKNIKVTTLANYNNNFPANSDITSICYFSFPGSRYDNDSFPADAFIEKYNQYITENESVKNSHIPAAIFWFRLKGNPALLPSTQQMQITIELQDGSILQDEFLFSDCTNKNFFPEKYFKKLL